MEQNTFDFDNPELESVDAYFEKRNFGDPLVQAEDLTDSSDESITMLLRKYSFDERPEVYNRKVKQIGDHLLTHLEDIDSDSLKKIFGTAEDFDYRDEGLSLDELRRVV